ncbi:MAG: ubiquinol-cytochrome c reductase iron-sulfur subunit [Gaiellaceae bacterium]
MEPESGEQPLLRPDENQPRPSLWPVGFAIGIAVVLVGLIVNPLLLSSIGGLITIVFGFLWIRDATLEYRGRPIAVEPERRELQPATGGPAPPASEGEAGMPLPEPGERFPRSRFLEGATLGLGGVIGGIVTLPVLGVAVLPAFIDQKAHKVDLGPLTDFGEGKWFIATFMLDPSSGEITRRTAFVRNNGQLHGQPSFTIISNRCAHLGCPVQANGPSLGKTKQEKGANGPVRLIPTQPAGFGCPCHGGQYDTEGNRTAGPPVRALDRYQYEIDRGRLILLHTYSVSHVDGQGAQATIHKYKLAGPGEHVDGPEQWFYPLNPPHH